MVHFGHIATAVAYAEVHRFETAAAAEVCAGFLGSLEEAVTYTTRVAKGFELWAEAAEFLANMVFGIELLPFVESGGIFGGETF